MTKLFFKTALFSMFTLLFLANSQAQSKLEPTRDVPLNLTNIVSILSEAPMEFSQAAQIKPLFFSLPLPSGNERLFKVVESPIMSRDFAALYPTFKTYSLVAVDNPQVTGRMTVTPYGLNAFLFLESGTMGIRPRDLLNPRIHEVYLGDGEVNILEEKCKFDEHSLTNDPPKAPQSPAPLVSITNGTTRRTFDLAIVTTGEFTANNGGTNASASAVVTASINAIQAIYDRELSVRFTLLAPFTYTNAATDPFTPDLTGGDSRTNQAAEVVAMNFADAIYDIGHVLHNSTGNTASWGGGGVAGLGVVCSNSTGFSTSVSTSNPAEPDGLNGPNKAAGWSGSSNNTTNGWYGLFAHEVGHMFNMPHTFNGSGGSCTTGNISISTAYEIASGNSLMSYNGICSAAQNITDGGTADDYFHANSLDRAVTFMNTIACQTATATNNTAPVVNANPCGGAYSIPQGTAFTLTGSGVDANGDVISYSWEQYDEDGFVNDNVFNQAQDAPTQGFIGAVAAASSIAPLFRSYPPTTSPSRTFPNINSVVLNAYATDFEPLPTVNRTLNFRLTGRDYNPNGGGIHSTDMAITVSGAAFSLTAPNGGQTLNAGGTTTVDWNIGGTAGYCTNVNIKLSIDGGLTYPYTLSTSTANDGSELVALPAGLTNVTTARIKVEQADNTCVVFFDISNANINITSTCVAPATTIATTTPLTTVIGNAALNLGLTNNTGTQLTSPISGSIDGSETVTATSKAVLECTTQACTNFSGVSAKFDIIEFYVSLSGTYTFTTNYTFSEAITLYTGTFDVNSQCTNLLKMSRCYNSPNTITGTNSTVSVVLATNQKYSLVVSNFFFGPTTGNYQVSFTTPGGGGIYNGVVLPANYAYTYLAVNTATNNVAAVSATSNFTALAVGSYQVYGATYYTGTAPPNPATPASWIGSSLNTILSGSTCQLFSSNSKPVTVTSALAVDLLNLQATPLSNTVKLTWQTANEVNNKGFQVERLNKTGDKWDMLGFVDAKGKAASYEFTDNTPLSINYYRLRQKDYDGKETLSKIVTATLERGNKLKVYPNPVSNILTVETEAIAKGDANGTFQIINLLGQQVISGTTTQQIDVSALPQGTYILKIGLEQAKFTKQ